MKKRTKITIIVILILSILISFSPKMLMTPEARAPDNLLHVDQAGNGDFLTIQSAIDGSASHDTIYIHQGIYYENIKVDRSLILKGEGMGKTIIDGNKKHSVLNITADDVLITTLSIRNSGRGTDAGIKIDSSRDINISHCDLSDNFYGIWFYHSSNNTISKCTIHDNYYGILVHYLSTYNTVKYCQINDNDNIGISLCCSSKGNVIHNCDFIANEKVGIDVGVWDTTIYLNNFIDNGLNARSKLENHWDYEKKGNYWSDYDEKEEGAHDNDGDGILDSPYYIPEENNDHYPFITQIRREEGRHDTPGFLFLGLFFAALTVFLLKKNH